MATKNGELFVEVTVARVHGSSGRADDVDTERALNDFVAQAANTALPSMHTKGAMRSPSSYPAIV